MNSLKTYLLLILSFVVVAEQGCRSKSALDGRGMPSHLILAVSTAGDNTGTIQSAFAPLKTYLEKKLNMGVEIIYTNDYTSVIEAIKAKKVHVAYLAPFSYVLASRTTEISPLVVVGENGRPSLYHCAIITGSTTGLQNMDEVKARAKDLTFCFADPASTSGHLIPRAYLNSIGLDPDHAFRQVLFAGNHQSSVLSVASHKVDLGCAALEYGIEVMVRKGMVRPDQIHILWKSDAIVSSPVVARNDLNRDFVSKIRNAYMDMGKEAPDVLMAYLKLFRLNPEKLSYMPAEDSMYNGIRKIAGSIPDLSIVK
jgi:phosphonate transport system substrate-binding protein